MDDELPSGMDVGELLPWLDSDGWRGKLRTWLNRALGITQTYALFHRHSQRSDENVFLGVLKEQVMTLRGGWLEDDIPDSGAVIVIANHPFGGADAIALSGICAKRRPDTLVMANEMASQLPGVQRWLLPLSIMGAKDSAQQNLDAMKRSLKHLREGGVLVVFPAGAVSRWRNDLGTIADPEWSHHVARLARKTNTPVLPVKFFGRAPNWYHLLGVIHPILRSALIVRVFLASKGLDILYRAGEIIPPSTLLDCKNDQIATALLRSRVEGIGEV